MAQITVMNINNDNGVLKIHQNKLIKNYNLDDFSRVEKWTLGLPASTRKDVKSILIKSIKGFTILNGITGSDQINIPQALAGYFLRWFNSVLYPSFDLVLNLLNGYDRSDQYTRDQITEICEVFGNLIACAQRLVGELRGDIPDDITYQQMKRSFQELDRYNDNNYADYNGYSYKQWFEHYCDSFNEISDICESEIDEIDEHTRNWWNYTKSWFSPKQWGIWVKSGFTATFATRKKTWEKVNDSVAIEKGNIIHARKNHIRVALNTLNNIMLILLEERNHVIDPDTDEDINRVPSRESINQTQSFKRQLVTRIGIVRDNIGYLLDPRNANVIGNSVQAAQAGILGQ